MTENDKTPEKPAEPSPTGGGDKPAGPAAEAPKPASAPPKPTAPPSEDRGRGRQPPTDSLFADQDLEPELDPEPGDPQRKGSLKPILLGVGVLLFGLLWYVSHVHHDRYFLEVKDNQVTVTRGLYFPFGTARYTPTTAYDSFTIPPGLAPELTGALTEQELDRVLRDLFVRVARREIEDLDRGEPERAEAMLLKANKLRHTTALEDRELFDMLGDVSFRRGLHKVRGIQELFDEALSQFRLAARQGSARFKNADQWVEAIARQRDELRALAESSGLDPDQVLARPTGRRSLLPVMQPAEPPATPTVDAGVP